MSVAMATEIAHLGAARGEVEAQVNLELGGKSPTIVYPDADLDEAVEVAVQGFCSHTGQVCVAGTRLFVHSDVKDAFLAKLTARLDQTRVGDGFAEGTQMARRGGQRLDLRALRGAARQGHHHAPVDRAPAPGRRRDDQPDWAGAPL